jgi:hypothetical protein
MCRIVSNPHFFRNGWTRHGGAGPSSLLTVGPLTALVPDPSSIAGTEGTEERPLYTVNKERNIYYPTEIISADTKAADLTAMGKHYHGD